ncbi:bifunctional folylpolyglutamate synthase/dihydrofolate synthase [Lentibacillus sp. Marseille-P4043]|uniref:bifunctional folylpolyglutamate synthase/dihydrofolate synthase n=1 Tax=Lentibacillus sp. Marseille-P4043 TaxID=2040293 RepID=UPI000D0BB62E|nr:folylpolyglutamate synthase/dihydrofolate synthase family protein [Lentibacillus sp. Marseille-P4043]
MFENFQQVQNFFANRKKFGIKPGLDRMKRLLQLLDNPQNKLNAIHVAGTNGKGSTINYVKDALRFNGYHVGVFTSPSLDGLTGHVLLDDQAIPEKTFISLVEEMYPAIQELDNANNHPTEFEIITALAFVYFVDRVDFALIETGMGGLQDTTNCFTPMLSIITNVARDHIAFLGDTIKEIAHHKAGIIKRNIPVIVGEMDQEALAVMKHKAMSLHAPFYQFAKEFKMKSLEQSAYGQRFEWTNTTTKMNVSLNMNGNHQQMNASLAMMALVLVERYDYSINWDKALAGIHQSQLPGRFELVHHNPTIIIDAAHNTAGIQSFIQTVLQNYADRERYLIFAGFRDKELDRMLNQLSAHFTQITLTTFDHSRAESVEALYHSASFKNKLINKDWLNAIADISNKPSNACYFITGSFHFISLVRKYFVKN